MWPTTHPPPLAAAAAAGGNQRGAVVVLNSRTGDILAQVSTPGFDPNGVATHDTAAARDNYQALETDPTTPLIDRATGGDQYAPGSSFKLLTATAMIENLGLSPDSLVEAPRTFVPPGTTHDMWNPGQAACGDGSGKVTLTEAFAQSCNTPFAIGGIAVGPEKMVAQAEKFGFNSELSTPLPVSASRFPAPADAAALAMDSIGQRDIRVTPMQMAMVGAAIANDGVVMKPNLVRRTLTADLEPVSESEPEVLSRAMSQQTAGYMHQMMVNEVKNGTGYLFTLPGIETSGKTGTAEITNDIPPHAWFVGNATIGDTAYTVAVVVENSGNAVWNGDGGSVAAPLARTVLEAKVN